MKAQNIILTIILLAIGLVGCSTDATYEELSSEMAEANQGETTLSLSIASSPATRATQAPQGGEETINSCVVAIFSEKGERIGYTYATNLEATAEGYKLPQLTTKAVKAYIVAVANPTNQAVMSSTLNFGDFKKIIQSGSLEASSLVKVYISSTPEQLQEGTYEKTITVTQLAARIELKNVNITIANVKNATFVVDKVTLLNQKTESYLVGEKENSSFVDVVDMSSTKVAYSYANVEEGHYTTLKLEGHITVDGKQYGDKTYTGTYIINAPEYATGADHNYVKGGYCYQLSVAASINVEDPSIPVNANINWKVENWEEALINIPAFK